MTRLFFLPGKWTHGASFPLCLRSCRAPPSLEPPLGGSSYGEWMKQSGQKFPATHSSREKQSSCQAKMLQLGITVIFKNVRLDWLLQIKLAQRRWCNVVAVSRKKNIKLLFLLQVYRFLFNWCGSTHRQNRCMEAWREEENCKNRVMGILIERNSGEKRKRSQTFDLFFQRKAATHSWSSAQYLGTEQLSNIGSFFAMHVNNNPNFTRHTTE